MGQQPTSKALTPAQTKAVPAKKSEAKQVRLIEILKTDYQFDVVKEIVELHGGQVSVQSVPGQGSGRSKSTVRPALAEKPSPRCHLPTQAVV